MQILSNLFEIKLYEATIATIGTFDGIHIGHQKILNSLVRFAEENDLNSVVITFDPHPRKIISKKNIYYNTYKLSSKHIIKKILRDLNY